MADYSDAFAVNAELVPGPGLRIANPWPLIHEKVLRSEHATAAMSLNNLALVNIVQGRLVGAEPEKPTGVNQWPYSCLIPQR